MWRSATAGGIEFVVWRLSCRDIYIPYLGVSPVTCAITSSCLSWVFSREAERHASGAAESGSEARADAGSRRLHAIVRPDAPFHTGTTPAPATPGNRARHSSRMLHTLHETHRMTSP